MNLHEIKSKLQDLKENAAFRNGIVVVFIVAAAYYLLFSSEEERIGPRYVAPPETVFGVKTDVEDIEDFEVKSVIDEMNERFLSKERELTKKDEVRERQLQEVIKQNTQLNSSLFELSNTISALTKSYKGEVYEVPDRKKTNSNNSVNVPTEVSPSVQQMFYRPQNQIISEAPQVFGNNIIRTITQSNIAEVNATGEVIIRDTGVITISERDRKVRDKTIQRAREVAASAKEEIEERESVHVLARGSLVTGIAINGVAAPTGNAANSEPMPVMFRIKKEAVMPNYFTMDIRECHVLGTATGRLRDERVYIRTDSISCITEDGVNIDEPFSAVAVSRGDGLLGVPATKVFKGQELLTNSGIAGALSGFALAIQPQRVQAINTTPTAQGLWETQNLDRYAAAGMGQGISNASDRIARFYLDLADQVSPILEMLPGTEVDFMIIGKTTFTLGSH